MPREDENKPSTIRICTRLSIDLASLSIRPDPRVLLTDIDRAGADIEHFIEGMDVGAYADNALTQAADSP